MNRAEGGSTGGSMSSPLRRISEADLAGRDTVRERRKTEGRRGGECQTCAGSEIRVPKPFSFPHRRGLVNRTQFAAAHSVLALHMPTPYVREPPHATPPPHARHPRRKHRPRRGPARRSRSGRTRRRIPCASGNRPRRSWCSAAPRAPRKKSTSTPCRTRGIPVLRRTSGGAAIVAGPGCLMYAVVLELRTRAPRPAASTSRTTYVLDRIVAALSNIVPQRRQSRHQRPGRCCTSATRPHHCRENSPATASASNARTSSITARCSTTSTSRSSPPASAPPRDNPITARARPRGLRHQSATLAIGAVAALDSAWPTTGECKDCRGQTSKRLCGSDHHGSDWCVA